jgi:hypothetical protein
MWSPLSSTIALLMARPGPILIDDQDVLLAYEDPFR